MKKLILFFFVALSCHLFAQNTGAEQKTKTNIAKIGLSSMSFYDGDRIAGLGGFSIGIEHALGKHGSFSVNIDYNRGSQKLGNLSNINTTTTIITSVEPDFRFYFQKEMKGIYLGIGLGYHQFTNKFDKTTVLTRGYLGTGIKLGFQTHLNDKISLHLYTGAGVIVDEALPLKIPLGIQVGYRFQ
jgi:Protein of unknown function (DUF3575)